MSRKLKVYSNDEVVASAEGEGRVNVSLSGLEPATTYPKGKYKVAFEENGKESEKVDVPEFTTNSILITSISFVPESKTVQSGSHEQLEPNIAPSTATNKALNYVSNKPETVQVDENTGMINALETGEAVITATTKDGSNKTAQITITVE
ncbi:Ig-like domain-containing protein [Staphylococcus pseudintermedius]|uniref:Ig-like domain-containing protein n=1 Tax=Staphylococcus pseudintermedius TaxID=283734 RepID=UPI0019ED8760|nr:Ig-like domain-containing protein [Staphylococcus pseudintermedius]EGQ3902569.1 phage tail protein [Staphylococcus pseudintermedius]EJG5860322.1 Ig domain-containing protein [Staphylococcus pseudintermedius]ELJ9082690.1 Ig domain-containing protein [Staphylococcus pseudintermedius]WMZ76059.1 Ig-like domain-containing protein [Staphylococcus pseudintermedius]WMZ88413.1 Ig-like domain-containing protein [Staphylococcus pseudintermedius]